MSARENMLGRIRGALGRTGGGPPPLAPPVMLKVQTAALELKIASFRTALEKLSAKTYVADSCPDAALLVREIVDGKLAIATDSPVLHECGILYPAVNVSKAEVGITGADYGLADTGSIVVMASSDPRLVSLLPPVHIAILKLERLLSGFDELLSLLPRPAEQTASMVLITGPSRTGDIEQILVRGVHGPGEVHVILLA